MVRAEGVRVALEGGGLQGRQGGRWGGGGFRDHSCNYICQSTPRRWDHPALTFPPSLTRCRGEKMEIVDIFIFASACVCVCVNSPARSLGGVGARVGGPAGKQTWSFWGSEIRRRLTPECVGLSAGSKVAQQNSQEWLLTHQLSRASALNTYILPTPSRACWLS